MNINSFDRSVKSWQFLGRPMIHVISFNSTGVGVYTIQHVSVARTNSEAVLNLVLNIF